MMMMMMMMMMTCSLTSSCLWNYLMLILEYGNIIKE